MARIITNAGIESLDNRECHFENGSPTNMPAWQEMKKLPEHLKKLPPNQLTVVSEYLIENTFNKVLCSFTGRVIHSREDRFRQFCFENGIKIVGNYNTRDFTVILLRK